MRREVAEQLKNQTRDAYDAAAKEFSDSRAKFWEELSYLGEHAVPGSRILDVGCGNGRLLSILPGNVEYIGVDFSKELLSIARARHPGGTFIHGNATDLPFSDREFDTVFSFATLHHIPSRELRRKAVAEMARVLRPGGTLIVTAWDLWHANHLGDLARGILRALVRSGSADVGDIFLPLGKKKGTRYIHGFTRTGLLRLLAKSGFAIVDSEIAVRNNTHRERNIVVIARRSQNVQSSL